MKRRWHLILTVLFALGSLEQVWMAWHYRQFNEDWVGSICVAALCAVSAFDNLLQYRRS